MNIDKTTWFILLISIFVAIFIMFFVATITILKINKVKKDLILKQKKLGNLKKVITRKNAGELLWGLKESVSNPLEDVQMEFLINTAIRNEYKTFKIINSKSNYESVSLTKIALLKSSDNNPDLTVFFIKKQTFNNEFYEVYKKLKTKKMIAVVNAKKRNKLIKNFLKNLKEMAIKYEIISIGKRIILITK